MKRVARPNQNLTREEAAIEREIAASHGYTAPSGPHAGQGSGFQLRLALISGELATVLLGDEDRRWFVQWLEQQQVDDPLYDDVPRQVAAQIRAAMQREHDRQVGNEDL